MTANPTLLSMPLAQNGQKNVIPETQATPGNGLFSQSTGFPSETSLPLGAGGVAPSREDFNGAFNLLGGIAFMTQKGFTFNYDATQDYVVGCIVIDPDDGLRYECIADMTAGTVAPHADTANTYWQEFTLGGGLSADQIPAVNKRDVITTSGTYTAPIDAWYKITAKGGGGGGGAGDSGYSGSGGGEGGTTIAYEHMTVGDTASVVIGAGGTGATAMNTQAGNGGNTSVTIDGNTYTGGGGKGGIGYTTASNGAPVYSTGGTGTIVGCAGGAGSIANSTVPLGGSGGGTGGATCVTNVVPTDATQGGGGSGATGHNLVSGGNGGNGYVWFEYFDTSLNP